MLDIKVLGPGCTNCVRLEKLVREVLEENNLEATVEKLITYDDFARYGVMITPALVVNGKVLTQGKVPTKHTLLHWLTDSQNK
ncbi:MAG: thioredoxin family protein [Bacteroidales bacterium]|jgi:small redox-active disulfide protein 2|nr:thioredoxin family protein [Bacteroidales bacterium]